MYESEICAEGIFVTFPWWLKNVKSRSKIALFSNERHFEVWFPKKRTITFLWSKLSKLHKKDPILHVETTFSLKQGETRTSHGPIPHPLTCLPKNFKNHILSSQFHSFDTIFSYAQLTLSFFEWNVYNIPLENELCSVNLASVYSGCKNR